MAEYNLPQLCEFLQFLKVLMIHYQVKANICKVHLFNLVKELRSLKNFKCVSKYIENLVGFYFRMTTLHK